MIKTIFLGMDVHMIAWWKMDGNVCLKGKNLSVLLIKDQILVVMGSLTLTTLKAVMITTKKIMMDVLHLVKLNLVMLVPHQFIIFLLLASKSVEMDT